MDFSYTREQQMVKKMLKEFAEKEIAPECQRGRIFVGCPDHLLRRKRLG